MACQVAPLTQREAHEHRAGDGGSAQDVQARRDERQRRDVIVAYAAAVEQLLQRRDDAYEQTCKDNYNWCVGV